MIDPSSHAISITGVYKSFGSKAAIRDLSMDIRVGEVFGLIGQNGAGKTTLIRMILGLLLPDAGTISIYGSCPGQREAGRIGYLPEERGLYQRDRVVDVVSYFAQLRGIPKTEAYRHARTWLNRLGLESLARHRVRELSKGNQQRVQLATVLVSSPELVILDEPLSGLDPLSKVLFIDVIRDLAKNGVTLLISTHSMELVEAACDRVLMLADGHTRMYGSVADILESQSRLLIRMSIDPTTLSEVLFAEPSNDGVKVTLRPGSSTSDLLRSIVAMGGEVSYLSSRPDSLEDIFVRKAAHQSVSTGVLK